MKDAHSVRADGRVDGHKRHLLGLCLRDQNAIERIGMMERKYGECKRVAHRDGQLFEAKVLYARWYVDCGRHWQRQFPERVFNRDLPSHCCGDKDVVGGILDCRTRMFRKSMRLGERPNESVRVQQQLH